MPTALTHSVLYPGGNGIVSHSTGFDAVPLTPSPSARARARNVKNAAAAPTDGADDTECRANRDRHVVVDEFVVDQRLQGNDRNGLRGPAGAHTVSARRWRLTQQRATWPAVMFSTVPKHMYCVSAALSVNFCIVMSHVWRRRNAPLSRCVRRFSARRHLAVGTRVLDFLDGAAQVLLLDHDQPVLRRRQPRSPRDKRQKRQSDKATSDKATSDERQATHLVNHQFVRQLSFQLAAREQRRSERDKVTALIDRVASAADLILAKRSERVRAQVQAQPRALSLVAAALARRQVKGKALDVRAGFPGLVRVARERRLRDAPSTRPSDKLLGARSNPSLSLSRG